MKMKQLASIVIAVCIGISMFGNDWFVRPVTAASATIVAGDVNTDAKLSIADAVLMQRVLMGTAALTAEQASCADLDGNRRLDGIDFTLLKRLLLQKFSSTPPVTTTAAATTTTTTKPTTSKSTTTTTKTTTSTTKTTNSTTKTTTSTTKTTTSTTKTTTSTSATTVTTQTEPLSAADYVGLVINEVCSSNKTTLKDASGAAPDWIELYNGSGKELPLDGIGLSDGTKKQYKFAFPAGTVLRANAYLLVFCDDAVTQASGEYHAAFKLSADGETVYLNHPEFGELDSVAVPALDEDMTYGRYLNGSAQFNYLTATPKASNDSAELLTVVDAPVLSYPGGFYDNPFDLDITDASGNTIYYTMDGSDPRSSDTAKIYQVSIPIYDNTDEPNVYSAITDISLDGVNAPNFNVDKGMVIRAVCKDGKGNYSEVVTGSYFVGKQIDFYRTMKVLSLVTDSDHFFDPDTGIYVVGNGYYEWKDSADYVEYESWDPRNPTNYNQSGREWERPVTIQIFENGVLAYTEDVGVRISGNATRSYAQKSMTFYARGEYGSSKLDYAFFEGLTDANGKKIKEFDKVTIRNGGNDWSNGTFRDDLIHTSASDLAISTLAKADYAVFLDGEFWGYYSMQEKPDDEYLESHYDIPKENVTTIKTYEGEGDAGIVQSYIDFMQWALRADLSVAANYQRVCDTIDIQSFMDYVALETYICNYDWSNAEGTNNWMLWRANVTDELNPYADGKWRFILYDTEFSTGLYDRGDTGYAYDALSCLRTEKEWGNLGALFYQLMENKTFAEAFYDNYLLVMEEHFAVDVMTARVDEYTARLRNAVMATARRYGLWEESINSQSQVIRRFFEKRPEYARKYLDLLCGKIQLSTENMIVDPWHWGTYQGDAKGEIKVESDGSISVITTEVGSYTYCNQVTYGGLNLYRGKTYELVFTVQADVAAIFCATIQQNGGEYTIFAEWQTEATDEEVTFTYRFTMSETCSDGRLGFDCGYDEAAFLFTDISLRYIGE